MSGRLKGLGQPSSAPLARSAITTAAFPSGS